MTDSRLNEIRIFHFFIFLTHNNNNISFRRGHLSAENSGNLWAPPDPVAGGDGAAAPPQEPHPRSRPLASIFGPSSLIWQPPQQSSFPSNA